MRVVALALLFGISILATSAYAQNVAPDVAPQPPDARLSGPTIEALNAIVKLRDAEMKAMAQDAERARLKRETEWTTVTSDAELARQQRETEWAEYSKSLWQIPPAE